MLLFFYSIVLEEAAYLLTKTVVKFTETMTEAAHEALDLISSCCPVVKQWLATAMRATAAGVRMTLAPLGSTLERVAVTLDPIASFVVDVTTSAVRVALETMTTVHQIKRGII